MKSNHIDSDFFDEITTLTDKIKLLNEVSQDVAIKHDILFLARILIHKVSVVFFTENFDMDMLYKYFNINVPNPVKKSVKKRKLEFFSGRLAAKFALEPFGYSEFSIRRLDSGEPMWPDYINGSISHAGDNKKCTAIACIIDTEYQAIQQEVQSKVVGIDIENKAGNIYLEGEHAPFNVFLSSQEQSLIASNKQPYIYLVVFSSKESVIKAVYAKYKVILPFLAIEYRFINGDSVKFEITDEYQYFTSQYDSYHESTSLTVSVNFYLIEQHILTICTL